MKSRSITRRLFLQIITLILSFSAMILVANTLLIRPLYEKSIENEMVAAMENLRDVEYLDEENLWIEQIEVIGGGKAFDITVEADGEAIYSSSKEIGLKEPEWEPLSREFEAANHSRPPSLFFQAVENWEDVGDGIQLGSFVEPRNQNELYVCRLEMDNGIDIVLVQPVQPIMDGIRQANILLLTGTLFFLVIASLIAFRVAKSFTSPIREMQQHVEQLSKLDFTGEVQVETKDELEELSRDINRLSNSLEEALASLELKNQLLAKEIHSQKRLISDASHELRTPLTLIKGYADEIAAGYVTDPEKQQEYVGYIAQESTKMKRLINEILELSRLESGRMPQNEEPHKVKEAIESFFEKYEGFLEEQELQLELDLFDEVCLIDTMRFEQVLANFLSNAAKYCDGNRQIRVWMKDEDDRIQIHVYNSGQPIKEEMMTEIWKGFYKADESRSMDQTSFGLGLSIVKAIQTAAGLEFGAYNADSGVVFWFEVKKA